MSCRHRPLAVPRELLRSELAEARLCAECGDLLDVRIAPHPSAQQENDETTERPALPSTDHWRFVS